MNGNTRIRVLEERGYDVNSFPREVVNRGPSMDILRHPHRLRSLNEAQHRVTSHALATLTNEAGRYPDEVLAATVLEQQDAELRRQVAAAFARCLPLPSVA